MDLTRFPFLVLLETFVGQQVQHTLNHPWITAEEHVGRIRVRWKFPGIPDESPIPKILYTTDLAVPGHGLLFRKIDARQVGKIVTETLERHQLASIAEVC
jgi:hypothetical protein